MGDWDSESIMQLASNTACSCSVTLRRVLDTHLPNDSVPGRNISSIFWPWSMSYVVDGLQVWRSPLSITVKYVAYCAGRARWSWRRAAARKTYIVDERTRCKNLDYLFVFMICLQFVLAPAVTMILNASCCNLDTNLVDTTLMNYVCYCSRTWSAMICSVVLLEAHDELFISLCFVIIKSTTVFVIASLCLRFSS
jgi:hypothetical protein